MPVSIQILLSRWCDGCFIIHNLNIHFVLASSVVLTSALKAWRHEGSVWSQVWISCVWEQGEKESASNDGGREAIQLLYHWKPQWSSCKGIARWSESATNPGDPYSNMDRALVRYNNKYVDQIYASAHYKAKEMCMIGPKLFNDLRQPPALISIEMWCTHDAKSLCYILHSWMTNFSASSKTSWLTCIWLSIFFVVIVKKRKCQTFCWAYFKASWVRKVCESTHSLPAYRVHTVHNALERFFDQ